MNRWALPAAAAVAAVCAYIMLPYADPDPAGLDDFTVNATYVDGTVHVWFADESGGTRSVMMEMQGLADTLQRTYDGHSFYDTIPFPEPPAYGWEVHPIILDISREGAGDVRIKTEVREAGLPAAPIIPVR